MRFHPPTPPSLGHMPSSNSQGGCSNSMVFWQGMPPTQSTHGLTFMAARCSQAPTSRSAQGLWCHEECSHSHWREVWTWLSVALCPLCLNNRPDRCSFRRATVVSGHHLRWSHHAWSLTPTPAVHSCDLEPPTHHIIHPLPAGQPTSFSTPGDEGRGNPILSGARGGSPGGTASSPPGSVGALGAWRPMGTVEVG